MGVYDLQEQEQLDDLKAWWRQHGNLVSGVVLAIAVGVLGVQGWRWWQGHQAEQASVLFGAVASAFTANDVAKAKDVIGELESRYGRTGYAPRGALLVAKMLYDSGDKAAAKVQLLWVIDHSNEDELKQIARIRLAEVQFDDKQYDDALRTLDAKHDEPFAGVYADLRGDILAAAGRAGEARTAYQIALTRLDASSPYRTYVQAKLDALGGATDAQGKVGGATGGSAGAAPPAAAPGGPAPPPAAAKNAPAASK
jgi:predicted negative regulator of RcsB-dependent stress response